MRKSISLLSVLLIICFSSSLLLVSCKKKEAVKEESSYSTPEENGGEPATIETPEQLGQEIFNGKGKCITCHKPDVKLVGPSLQDIAKIYKEKNASIATFLKGDEKPIVDPTQFEVMKTNFALTKTFTDEERQGLEVYVLSQGK